MVISVLGYLVNGISVLNLKLRKALIYLLYGFTIISLFVPTSFFGENTVNTVNLRVYFEKDVPKVFEGIDIKSYIVDAFSNIPEKTLRVVNIVDISKESVSRKVNDFVENSQGNYVRFMGSYYYTSDYNRYRYDYEKKEYVPDKYGNYVRLSDYPWAREEREKYIFSVFYKRYEYKVTESKYFLSFYVIDIDIEKFFVKSFTPVLSVGTTFKEAIQNATKFYSENINVYSPDKIDVVVFFDKSFNKLQKMYILSSIQEDSRYNIYDRTYLQELFDILSQEEIIGKQVTITFKPPRYIFFFQNYTENVGKTSSDQYYYFDNPVNGQFIKKQVGVYDQKILSEVPVKVEVGKYYKYDSDKKNYVLDMKNGQYVRYFKAYLEQEEYTKAYNFYDVIYTKIEYANFYNNFLLKVVDTESGIVIGSRNVCISTSVPLKEPIDRFGSEKVNFEYLTKVEGYRSASIDVRTYLKSLFPLRSYVSSTDGLKVTLPSGKNIGLKPGFVFFGIHDGFTTGYIRITNVYETSAEGYPIYILPGEYFKENTLLLESRTYMSNPGFTFRGYISKFGLGMELGLSSYDIYGNYTAGILLGFKIGGLTKEYLDNYMNDVYLKLYTHLNEKIDIFTSLGIAMPKTDDEEYNKANIAVLSNFGFRFSSYERKSLFTFGGTGFYSEFGIRIISKETTIISPNISIGLEYRNWYH